MKIRGVVLIIVVGDTPSSVEINALGAHWGPIQDGGRALGTHPRWRPLQQAASVYEASTYIMSMVRGVKDLDLLETLLTSRPLCPPPPPPAGHPDGQQLLHEDAVLLHAGVPQPGGRHGVRRRLRLTAGRKRVTGRSSQVTPERIYILSYKKNLRRQKNTKCGETTDNNQ